MASTTSLLCFSVTLLFVSHLSLAKVSFVSPHECRIERLHAHEPRHRLRSEAGVTEFYDITSRDLNCAGVSVARRTIQPGGLLLPSFSNAPSLVYIIQGRGTMGVSVPGCPESFQVFDESRESGRRRRQFNESAENQQGRREIEGDSQWQGRDQHQTVNRIRQGDVIALFAGVTNWAYNDGESPLVAITVTDTSNSDNQLDRHHREFMLAGSQRQQQEGGEYEREQQNKQEQNQQGFGEQESFEGGVSEVLRSRNNILRGFDTEFLADALDISRELASRLQRSNENRGEIVRVRQRLDIVRPRPSSPYGQGSESMNGIEQAFCTMKIKENIGDASSADVFNPRAGRITVVNNRKLPILDRINLSATRGSLRRDAFVAPHWSINAHNIMYVIRGRARCQVVDNRGRRVFNGEIRQGQILVIPQHFAQLKQARSDDFEWVSFTTNEIELASPLVGKKSVLKGLPEEVIMNSYGISRQDARNLKWNRGQEFAIFPSARRSESYPSEERGSA